MARGPRAWMVAVALALPCSMAAQTYDVVLRGGRVMDPESGLDAVRGVGMRDGRVAAVTAEPLDGREMIDARGLVVAPGFIDLHAHGHDPFSADLQVRDGVTTALELEGGVYPVADWYAERSDGWRINRKEMEYAVGHPIVMIASDGTPFVGGRAHPRGAGTLGLLDALRKMTLMPARRLEPALPEMCRKGRVAVGADADLTLFDPATVIDRATFADPAQPSAGIPHVMVGGVFVVHDGEIVPSARPGKPVRRRPVS